MPDEHVLFCVCRWGCIAVQLRTGLSTCFSLEKTMNGITNAFKAVQNFMSVYLRSIFSAKGLFSIAMVSALVAGASQIGGDIGNILNALAAAVLAGFGIGVMRKQATSDQVGVPEFNFKNLKTFLTDGAITLGLTTVMGLGLLLAGGGLGGGAAAALLALIYSQLALVNLSVSLETLPKAENQNDRLDKGIKTISSIFDLKTILGTIFAKPLNTAAAIGISLGLVQATSAVSGAGALATAAMAVLALVTNAHVWSKVYRAANCESDCSH